MHHPEKKKFKNNNNYWIILQQHVDSMPLSECEKVQLKSPTSVVLTRITSDEVGQAQMAKKRLFAASPPTSSGAPSAEEVPGPTGDGQSASPSTSSGAPSAEEVPGPAGDGQSASPSTSSGAPSAAEVPGPAGDGQSASRSTRSGACSAAKRAVAPGREDSREAPSGAPITQQDLNPEMPQVPYYRQIFLYFSITVKGPIFRNLCCCAPFGTYLIYKIYV
jgi:hypothetical protein